MKRDGFTLIELLAVIAILGILVVIALPNVLKLYNNAKKNAFIAEVKTVYNKSIDKYVIEKSKGKKLSYISSKDDTKLDMSGRELQYCVFLNKDGSIKSMKVSNGELLAVLPETKKIDDLTIDDLIDGNLNDEECGIKKPISFAVDEWEMIQSVSKGCVNNPSSCPYSVGDEKEIDLGSYGKHTLRLTNLNSPSDCNSSSFSQSACGFVVEFKDIITTYQMNDSNTNFGGWKNSKMRTFLNSTDDSSSIYNALPVELKNVIIDTNVISGHGSRESSNFNTTDKLYLLATAEIWSQGRTNTIDNDSARTNTRQLDYYQGVSTSDSSKAIKLDSSGSVSYWWLRSARSNYDYLFYNAGYIGDWGYDNASVKRGVSPAFRVGYN